MYMSRIDNPRTQLTLDSLRPHQAEWLAMSPEAQHMTVDLLVDLLRTHLDARSAENDEVCADE